MTRDIVRVTGDKFKCEEYVARQSWISALSHPQKVPAGINLTGFRLKSLIGDIESNGFTRLKAAAKSSAALVIDLASDRHGVWDLENGSFLSNLASLKKQKVLRRFPNARLVSFGSTEHLALFSHAVERGKQELEEAGLFSRSLILKIPFTSLSIDGERIETKRGPTPRQIRAAYEPYYQIFKQNGFRFLPNLPDELAVSTPEHDWGPGINHFVDEAYYWWGSEIEKFVSS
ncbi:hypothetical protein CAMM_04355 [Corynebacterium ammoniagenes DSM 20306]|uniref:Uncharacterized protein n=1 Tax=Corynebacterium ammoniagenes DSM 20306 TaxID=649754 RepID=A0ABP2IH20_CORAM|nr:hypothetical protein CAMM_04355 [Corynebacterium ammoniagenes DSM 20306]AQS73277.1 hypothetical protein CA40472_04685 [Corynebacterium ammoniagenes]EFG80257.1 hypothetical protein HMPREF0281_02350 [Corynebacterium ammoniagenes DSM 20306]